MQAAADRFMVCGTADLSDPGSRAFQISLPDRQIEGFVIHWQANWYAYYNHCPHTGVNLNWAPDQFFDLENSLLQCSMHGALFEPHSGLCIHGPCLGKSLLSLPLALENDIVYIVLSNIKEFELNQ